MQLRSRNRKPSDPASGKIKHKKSEVADQENSEKEQDHRTSGTELSEKKQNMNKSITEEAFYISKIPDDIFEKMQGKSYKADCTVPREDLRYLHVLHMGFDGQTKEGELVVNKAIAEDVLAIFRQLYEAEYPIEKSGWWMNTMRMMRHP